MAFPHSLTLSLFSEFFQSTFPITRLSCVKKKARRMTQPSERWSRLCDLAHACWMVKCSVILGLVFQGSPAVRNRASTIFLCVGAPWFFIEDLGTDGSNINDSHMMAEQGLQRRSLSTERVWIHRPLFSLKELLVTPYLNRHD